MVEDVERVGIGDVVDEEEGIRAEIGGGPETAVFFLAGRVGEHEVVRVAIHGARYRVRVLLTRMLAGGRRRRASRVYRISIVYGGRYLWWGRNCGAVVSASNSAPTRKRKENPGRDLL